MRRRINDGLRLSACGPVALKGLGDERAAGSDFNLMRGKYGGKRVHGEQIQSAWTSMTQMKIRRNTMHFIKFLPRHEASVDRIDVVWRLRHLLPHSADQLYPLSCCAVDLTHVGPARRTP